MRVLQAESTIQHYVSKFKMAEFLNANLLQHLQLFHFPAYSHIYIEEDEQHFLYFLVEGQAQCHHYHLDGTLAIFAISNPFMAIGDFEILNQTTLKSNVIAVQDATLLGIARDVVERYGANDPRFLRFLIDQLREKLYQTNFLQMNQVLPVVKRLAVYILAYSANQADGIIELPSKEGLASLLGTTNRHLNRVLKELVEAKAISADYPCVRILNRDALYNITL